MNATYVLKPGTEARQLLGLKFNLAQQFLLVALCVLVLGMFAMGTWVTRRIEKGIVETWAAYATLQITNFIAPHVQELASRAALSEHSINRLDAAMAKPTVRTHSSFIKIWNQDGTIVYDSEKHPADKVSQIDANSRIAWDGTIAAHLDKLDSEGNTTRTPLLRVYSPIRDFDDGEIIAVMELHEQAENLKEQLTEAEWHIWMLTIVITLSMIGALFSIVADGSSTIDEQRIALTRRVAQLSTLLHQNGMLRARIERAAQNATEDNERIMRRVGYDLHDGVAQLIGLALLLLDRIPPTTQSSEPLETIQSALSEALTDIRNICKGLFLPEIQSLNLKEAILFMVHHHERRTGTQVTCALTNFPEEAAPFVKILLCRLVQEGLNNAFKHAGGKSQKVSASAEGHMITVEIADEGPGMDISSDNAGSLGMGLVGLADRIESIGGTMTILSRPGEGTRLVARIPLAAEGATAH